MLQKFGKKVMNNFGLKLLAVFFSIILWIVVVNIDDPSQTRPYTTSVSLENKSYITSMNKWADYLDGNNTITFYVQAKRSIQEKLSNSNFSATADAQKIEYDELTGTYRVPVSVSVNRNSSDISITSKQLYLELELEDSASKQFPIKTNAAGTVASGCALGNVEITDANVLKVFGPASVVNQINTVVATISVDGMSEDITDRVAPVCYDAEGNVVDTTKLTMSVSTVNISAQILNTKDIELEFKTTGTPADGYLVGDITYRPQTVRIKGEAANLNTVNKITVPEEVLDVTGASDDIEKTVDISTYLPAGTSLVISSEAKIDVTVQIEPVKTKTVQIPTSNLEALGLENGYQFTYDSDEVSLTVSGRTSLIDSLNGKTITGTIDLSGMRGGTHSMQVSFDLDEDDYQYSATYVSVTVSSENDNTDAEDTGTTVTTGSRSNER